MIVRRGIDAILNSMGKSANDLEEEQSWLRPDTKFYDRRRKTVLNKHARYNLCFDEKGQKAEFAEGKGTVVGYD